MSVSCKTVPSYPTSHGPDARYLAMTSPEHVQRVSRPHEAPSLHSLTHTPYTRLESLT